ncbi:mitochondrial ribonuclease P catalytic subunit [Lucilia cuprina]|uniref:mitochondrial ribonuclease P catalytic subunit n=1 Tax=Lucilia cuprina TaxID=7375 RepID=UPI001F06EFD1|nr:mitochondrial ribonuclease P catalytic subunit [Lucilia cuprina]
MHLSKLYRFIRPKIIIIPTNKIILNSNNLRLASNFKRPQLNTKTDQLAEIKDTYFRNRTELTKQDWQNVTEILIKNYKHINTNNVDAVIVGVCSDSEHLSLAKSYIKHIQNIGKQPNEATLGKLLRVYNNVYHVRGALDQEEQAEILEIYNRMRAKHEILDSLSCENLICGLVATEKWREGLELLEMMKVSSNAPSLPAYTEMIIKAFATNDLSLGWQLLHQMLEQRKQPKCEIFITLLNTLLQQHFKDFQMELEKLLTFLETHDIVITQKVVETLQDVALKHPNLLEVTESKLKRFGKCSSCGLHMKNVSLSDEDFTKLQTSFLDKVLIRNDVFQKSTPQEVKRFCDYVERTGPYDCVVDGLNVAYSMGSRKPTQALANLLASVVKYFHNKNKYVLILGRKHMNNWPKKTMQYVKDNAAVFLANDISQDDPFLLYATLKSGQTTDFFSRDLMRQHAFLLGPELKVIFRRWQQEHQYSLVTQTESGKIIVKEPIRHLICTHKVEDVWHVPYKNEFSPHITDTFEVPEQWLCLKIIK